MTGSQLIVDRLVEDGRQSTTPEVVVTEVIHYSELGRLSITVRSVDLSYKITDPSDSYGREEWGYPTERTITYVVSNSGYNNPGSTIQVPIAWEKIGCDTRAQRGLLIIKGLNSSASTLEIIPEQEGKES